MIIIIIIILYYDYPFSFNTSWFWYFGVRKLGIIYWAKWRINDAVGPNF